MASLTGSLSPVITASIGQRAKAAPRAAKPNTCEARRSVVPNVRTFGRHVASSRLPEWRDDSAARCVAVAAASSYTGVREIPIFPLNMVALPAATVYLNIFEARYRVLFNTLLYGEAGLEDGLVNTESPFAGTREFGMCMVDQSTGGMAAVGTLLHVEEFQRMEDGQMQISCRGVERFRVSNVTQERPVLICDVEFLEREDDSDPFLHELRDEVVELCRSTLDLSYRMGKINATESQLQLPEFDTLGPHDLSCWFAFNFLQDNYSKQAILEIDSVKERLEKEREMMQKNLNYLSAAAAVENAFKDEPSP